MLHCTWMVCWIANDIRFLFRTNCFPTDPVILKWNRCSHIHWPIYLLHWNMDQAKDGQESTFYMTTPPLISVRLLSLFWLLKRWKFKTIHHIHLTWVPVTSFYFQGLRKCFLEKSIRLEVLLAALFISVSTKRRLCICFSRLGKKVTKMCFSKEGILWRFVLKICLIKRNTEVIRTQWQNLFRTFVPRRKCHTSFMLIQKILVYIL